MHWSTDVDAAVLDRSCHVGDDGIRVLRSFGFAVYSVEQLRQLTVTLYSSSILTVESNNFRHSSVFCYRHRVLSARSIGLSCTATAANKGRLIVAQTDEIATVVNALFS